MSKFAFSPRLFVILSALAVVSAAQAQSHSLEAFQGLYTGDHSGGFEEISGNGGANDASNPFLANASFTGNDSHGNQQTMTVSGEAYSSASYGALHIYGGGTVTNPYYNASNAPYYQDGGSPDLIGLHGNAGWSDTLTYTGLAGTGYSVNFFFQLEGTVSGDTEAGLNFSTSDPTTGSYNPRTNLGNVTWATPAYQIGANGTLDINVDVYAGMTTYVSDKTEGVTYSSYADYSNTLTLTGMQVMDSSGNVVSGWNVTSDSGTNYPKAVPEPMSVFAVMGGVGALVIRRRKR